MAVGNADDTGLDRLVRAGRRLVQLSAKLPHEAVRFLEAPALSRRRTPPPGAFPGAMVLLPDAHPSAVQVMAYDAEALEERPLEDPTELRDLLAAGGRTLWIDVEGFGDHALLDHLREVLGIHPLAMADIVNVPQRPKAELYDGRLLIVSQMAQLSPEGTLDIEQVSIVLGPGWVLTFRERPGDVFDPVRARIRASESRVRQLGADYLAYALLDAVVDGYFPVVEAIGGVIDALEEEVLVRSRPATIARIHGTRRTLLTLHRVQWRQRDAIGLLLRDDDFPISPTVRIYLRDAHDHAFQTVDAIESQREMAAGLMDLYLSSTNNRLNEVMKTLTIMATIFIPLTFLSGVYGMNFRYMPELAWRWGYPAVWALMVLIAAGLLGWFRMRGWLDTSEPTETEPER